MLAKITAYNGTIYKFATSTQDTNDGIYTGRIVEEIDFTSQSSDNGAAPNTINITIRNDDNFIPKNVDLWGATIDLTATNGKSWRGKITFFSFDADGNVYITATEKSLPELELQMPDEVRQVYTIDDNFHQSSQTMTIPLVVGGTHSSPISLPTILIDKQNGIYLICTGEIREIVAVYNGSEVLPRSAYIPYRGWPTQAEHPGFAYVQIEEPYRTNADGSYAEINVDVVGLKLGNHTEAECRNGARFLYYFLTTPATGVNGWGLGIDPSEIDTASFNTAITLCDASNFKLDGIMWLRQGADAWINQICQAIHGKYSININGKRTLTIDYAGAASKANFGPNDMKISRYGKNAYTGAIYNKGVFSYGYNPITGLFMQSAQYENSESVAQIGEQKFVGESYLINDAATALAVLEYTCKKSQIAAESIEFETDRLDTLLYAGDLITISRSDISISGTFQIKSISTSESKSIISASRFDSSVFIVGGTHTNINWNSEKPITPALTPAEATNLLLTTGFDINPDGTGTPYIKGTFTPPAGGWIAAAVQYGIGTNPANWTELALITNGQFVIQPVSVGAVYSVRVRMITATGHSDYVTGQITAAGDSVPPEIPTIAVNATDKSVIVQCAIDNPPYDMGGFQIHRKKHSESVYTLIGNVAANRGYASFADYVDEWVAYDYKVKSYDRSGNLSDFSDVKTVTVTGIQANDVAATALKIPTGSILRLSAKGCTTASIKQTTDASGNPVYGVKDVSGYNHHGQAFGGVSVLDGGEGFGFDGTTNGYMTTTALANSFSGVAGATFSMRASLSDLSAIRVLYSVDYNGSAAFVARINTNKNIQFGGKRASSETATTYKEFNFSSLALNKEYLFTFVYDFENAKIRLFIDGVLTSEQSYLTAGTFMTEALSTFYFGRQGGSRWNGTIKDFRIYPRALSATEVKSMYMLPDEAIFGQLNADLIGANVINASNLVKTQALITESAQISQAVVNNLNVTGNATFTAGLTSTLNSAKSDAAAKANAAQSAAISTAADDATNKANAVQTNLDNLQVGGRNYFKELGTTVRRAVVTTDRQSVTLTITASYTDCYFNLLFYKIGYANGYLGNDTNKIYTLSFDCSGFASGDISVRFGLAAQSSSTYIMLRNGRCSITFTSGNAPLRADGSLLIDNASGSVPPTDQTVVISNIKIEEGNKATDWTPAPEDVEASIASGDASTLASAKTYAEGKASTAQSNAEAAAAAALAAVTNNIYYTGTTKIDGGVIQTESIGAAAIAAESISADKLSVVGNSIPSCVFHITAQGIPNYTPLAAGYILPDLSGRGNTFATNNAAWTSYNNAYGWHIYKNNSHSGIGIRNKTQIAIPSYGFTMFFRFYLYDLSAIQYLFDIKPDSATTNNRLLAYVGTNGAIVLYSYNASATASAISTPFQVTARTYYTMFIRSVSATNLELYLAQADAKSNISTYSQVILTANARSAVTCPVDTFCFGSTVEGNYSSNGILGNFQFYNRALSDGEIMTIQNTNFDTESGQITADRISTSAIKSRNWVAGQDETGTSFTTGTFLNLQSGTINSPNMCVNASAAKFKGEITTSSGLLNGISIPSIITAVESNISELSFTYRKSIGSTIVTATQSYSYGYIKYSNKFIMQFGCTKITGSMGVLAEITLPKAMDSANYDIFYAGDFWQSMMEKRDNGSAVYNKSASKFALHNYLADFGITTSDNYLYWLVLGKSA